MRFFLLLMTMLSLLSCQSSFKGDFSRENSASVSTRMESRIAECINSGKNIVYLSPDKYSDDNTEYIQSLLKSNADAIIITADPGIWKTKPLFIERDNLTIIFEPGARLEALEGAFQNRGDCLLTMRGSRNISILGSGGDEGFYMHRDDYQSSPYLKGEWRHCLSLLSTENIIIEDLVIAESGGDGIYIGQNRKYNPIDYCLNTTITNCRIINNHRQGISIISAENLIIQNCVMEGTGGTPPSAGIDFEPNRSTERFVNCRVINCRFIRNGGPGIHIFLRRFDETTVPLSIILENNYCRNNLLGIGINITRLNNNPKGEIRIINNDFGCSLFNKIPRHRSVEIKEL